MKLVYFLKPIGMAGPIKIGCSSVPKSRLMNLDIWSPFPLELIASADGDFSHERALHWRFRNNRSHGEWFFVTQELLAVIDHVRLNGVLPPLEAAPRGAAKRGKGHNPCRTGSRGKGVLSGRIRAAERHAYGYWNQENRPQWVKDAIESWQGPRVPYPDEGLVAKLEAYIADLRSRPKCSRTLQDWTDWRDGKALRLPNAAPINRVLPQAATS